MDEKKKKNLFLGIIVFALCILIAAGSTFAYFQVSINSDEGDVDVSAAIYKLSLDEDNSLIKSMLIPSEERYVDIGTIQRRNPDGTFIKPYTDGEGKKITEGTACIDDNGYEICSIYTFTIYNDMLDNSVSLYMSLIPSVNTFENLYFKVLDDKGNVVMPATHIIDDRYMVDSEGNYLKDEETGELIKKDPDNFDTTKMSSIPLTNLNGVILPKSSDGVTKSSLTYSIVLWIMEIHDDQTEEDSGKIFASTLQVSAGDNVTGNKITGSFASAGVE